MLKHFLTICLILSTLGFSSVWALDEHIDAPLGSEQAGIDMQASADDDSSDTDNHPDDDRCCHASGHLLGLLSGHSADALHTGANLAPAYRFFPFSRSSSPPYRPPLG